MTGHDRPVNKRAAFEGPMALLRPVGYDPDMRRPPATIAGSLLVILSGLVGFATIMVVWAQWDQIALAVGAELDVDGVVELTLDLRPAVAVFAVIDLLFSLTFGVLLFFGFNWARVLVMISSALSISFVFVSWWARDQELTVRTVILSVAVDILVLLALSSRAAAAYARRKERP